MFTTFYIDLTLDQKVSTAKIRGPDQIAITIVFITYVRIFIEITPVTGKIFQFQLRYNGTQ